MTSVPALIAVVDDDAHVCKALHRLLRSSGFAVEVHSSGAAFLERLSERKPDCIVLDLHMPEMNGFEVQAQLQRRGLHVPVVVITGHATPEACARALANGASAYICKPIDVADLLGAIRGALLSGSA